MEKRWEPGGEAIDGESFGEVIAAEPFVVIHFWAAWDAHERDMDRALQPVRDEFEDRVRFRSADIDRPDLVPSCQACGVVNVPTLVGFVRGRKAWTVVGLRQADELRALVSGLVGEEDSARRSGEPTSSVQQPRREQAWKHSSS